MIKDVNRNDFLKILAGLSTGIGVGKIIGDGLSKLLYPPLQSNVDPYRVPFEGHFPAFEATMQARESGVQAEDLEHFPKQVLESIFYTSIMDANFFGPSLGSSTMVGVNYFSGVGASILSQHQTNNHPESRAIRLLKAEGGQPYNLIHETPAKFSVVHGAYDMVIATYLLNETIRDMWLDPKFIRGGNYDFIRGQELYCAGFPDASRGTFLSRILVYRTCFVDTTLTDRIELIDSPVDPENPYGMLVVEARGGAGMSGAGVFNHRGTMMGILRGGEENTPTGYVSLFPPNIHDQLESAIKNH